MASGHQNEPAASASAEWSFRPRTFAVSWSARFLAACFVASTVLLSGCLVIPIPCNSYDASVRTNVGPLTASSLGTGGVARVETLLRLGEPDGTSSDERQFRYHTELIKCHVFWAVGGNYSVQGGEFEVKKYYDLVLRFDQEGELLESEWLAGADPKHLQQKAHWTPATACLQTR